MKATLPTSCGSGRSRLLYETFYDDFDPAACGRRLDRFGFRDQMVLGAMSRGMRTLLELIFVLSRQAELFLLDEPFAALDPQRREEAMQLIGGPRRSGRRDLHASAR